jgi:hypothetical protein
MKVRIKNYVDHKTLMGKVYYDWVTDSCKAVRLYVRSKYPSQYKKYNLKSKLSEPNYEKFSSAWYTFPIRVIDFFLSKINDHKEKNRVKIKIESHDTYNMDVTLTLIILPMLKQLKEQKNGAPIVDDEDVPEELKSTSAPPKEHEYDVDDNHFKRWDYVIDEMIWAFEHLIDNEWENKFYPSRQGDFKITSVPMAKDENGEWVEVDDEDDAEVYRMDGFGDNENQKIDIDGLKAMHKKIDNGLFMFAKYYRSLWS